MEQETARLLGIAPYEGMKLAMEREAAGRPGLALELVDVFLHTVFEGGRHQRRIDQITELENRG